MIEGFQKLSKVSESLRKTAKLTAAQNKEENGNVVDCLGSLIRLIETEGFIPRYCTDIPQDKVDLTLKDQKEYLHKLVTQDLGFGQQIEDSIRKIQIQKEMNEEADRQRETEAAMGDQYDEDFTGMELDDEAMAAMIEFQAEQRAANEAAFEEEDGD